MEGPIELKHKKPNRAEIHQSNVILMHVHFLSSSFWQHIRHITWYIKSASSLSLYWLIVKIVFKQQDSKQCMSEIILCCLVGNDHHLEKILEEVDSIILIVELGPG